MTLYEIDERILSCIDPETGEITDPSALEAAQLDRNTKLENIALAIKNYTADAAAYKAEKAAFEAKQRKAEKTVESLKQYLANALNGEKFRTAKVDCTFRTSRSVTVEDVYKLPDEYLRYSEPTADKTALKAALEEGKEFPGVQIVVKTSIVIK